MKCLKCGKILPDNEKICPSCHYTFDIDMDLDLPMLKKENKADISKDIFNLSNDENDDTQLKKDVFDIPENNEVEIEDNIPLDNDQFTISLQNKDKIEEDIVDNNADNDLIISNNDYNDTNTYINESSNENLFSSAQSVSTRKRILIITSLVIIVLLIIICLFTFIFSNSNESTKNADYSVKLEEALQEYYDSSNIDNVIYLVNEYRNDYETIASIQEKTNNICSNWINLYFSYDASNKEEFENITQRYRLLLNGLHDYTTIKINEGEYSKVLLDNDYNNLINRLENIYSDGIPFYEAKDLYNTKDYNKSFNSYDKINEDNLFYEKAIIKKNDMINNVINLLKNDIIKLESDIKSLSASEKYVRYSQIKKIISEYNTLYYALNLNENKEYRTLLNDCEKKVKEYKHSYNDDNITNNDINLGDMGNNIPNAS